jgi:hypothetical protein
MKYVIGKNMDRTGDHHVKQINQFHMCFLSHVESREKKDDIQVQGRLFQKRKGSKGRGSENKGR